MKLFCYVIKPYTLKIDGKIKTIKGERWFGSYPCEANGTEKGVEVAIFDKNNILQGTRTITLSDLREMEVSCHEV